MSEKIPSILFGDMLDSVSKIFEYTHGMDYEIFLKDRKTQDAVVRIYKCLEKRQIEYQKKQEHFILKSSGYESFDQDIF